MRGERYERCPEHIGFMCVRASAIAGTTRCNSVGEDCITDSPDFYSKLKSVEPSHKVCCDSYRHGLTTPIK